MTRPVHPESRLTRVGVAIVVATGLVLAIGSGKPPPAGPQPDPLADRLAQRLADDVAPILQAYCLRCHGPETAKAGVQFDRLTSFDAALDMAGDLDVARDLIAHHDMPPLGEPAPTDHEALVVTQWIDDLLAYTPPDAQVDPGWFTIHRLNRHEYANTLRDLLHLDEPPRDLANALPPDDTGYGFDNIADVLTVSPLHLEAYLNAGERALARALGPPAPTGDQPVRLAPLRPPPNGGPLPGGGHMLWSNGSVSAEHDVPVTADYEISARAWATHGGDEPARMLLKIDHTTIAAHWVKAERGRPAVYTAVARVKAGRRTIAAHFVNDYYEKGVADRNLAVEWISLRGPIDAASIARPDAFHRLIRPTPRSLGGDASDKTAARAIIERFAARAFRRPLRPGESSRLMKLYIDARRRGDAFDQAVRPPLLGVLASPSFLYRSIENPAPDDPAARYTLNDHELAVRLSYFLWSSTPDKELRALADDGRLRDDHALRAQARRLLADPRADAFIHSFAGQWLHLRNLEDLQIDWVRFPEYDDELRDAMITEATMLFGDVARSDRSVLDLLASRDAFVNGRLARLYGLDGIPEDAGFQRITLPEGAARGGLLTSAAVLTVTSNPTRTSPVKRGLFVLEGFLGAAPPPPPPDIPPLERAAERVGDDAPLREQLAAHLTEPTCAACHARMDPIGLALENFDAIGRWRDADRAGRPIDASGELPGGVRFDGPAELKRILLDRDDQFVENLTGKVLTYALGRGIEPFDRPTIASITDHTRANADRFGALIEAVVLSDAFRTCRGRNPDDH